MRAKARTKRRLGRLGLLAGLVALRTMPGVAQDIEAGREIYGRYCSSCHGEAADGRGPLRPVLTVPPKDLTRLAAENGGMFPLGRVMRRIDGRDPMVSHGSEMPIFGEVFSEGRRVRIETETGDTIETSAAVADLLAWLRAIQQQ